MVREGVQEEGRAGRGYMKEGRLVGESMHGVREGVKEEGRAQRERNEGGEARRGEHGVRGWMECWREGGSEAGREIREYVRECGTGGEEGGKDGREGDTNDQCQAWVMHRSMPVVVSIHSVLTCW